MFVILRQHEGGLLLERLLVESVLQDGFHGAEAGRADPQRTCAGRFQPGRRVAITEPHDAEARAVALFRVRAFLEDAADECACVRSGALSPADQTRRRPLQVLLVRLGSVRRVCCEAALLVTAQVSGDTTAVMEDLHGLARDPHVHCTRTSVCGTL